MKFCPTCGSVRENKTICECGYNYETGESELKQSMNKMTEIIKPIVNQVAVSLEEIKKKEKDTGDLLTYSSTSSGGMMGSYYSDELSFKDHTFTVINQNWHHGKKTKITYKADKKEVAKIKKLIVDNNLCVWNELPIDQSIIYDAPTSNIYIKYEKVSISISTRVILDKEEMNLLHEINSMIASFVDDKNIISEEVLVEGEDNPMLSMCNPDKVLKEQKFCPECGKAVDKEKEFCPDCGHKFEK